MLLTTEDQFIKVIPTAEGVEWEDFETYRDSAEYWLKSQILGDTLYSYLNANGGNSDLTQLVEQCRTVIALKLYYEAIPFTDLTHTPNGFGVVSNGNITPASKERVANLRAGCIARFDTESDNLLDVLESTKIVHDEWKSSPAYSLLTNCLIVTAREFSQFGPTLSRSALLKLKPWLLFVQEDELSKKISADLVDQLLEQQRDEDLTPESRQVLALVKPALAMLGIASGIENMAIYIDEKGVVKIYQIGKSSAIDEVKQNNTKIAFEKIGRRLLNEAINHLDKNLDKYPLYRDSEELKLRNTPGYQNTADSPIFVFGA